MEVRKNKHIYYPMLVDENDIFWAKIKKISENKRKILLSAELPSLLMELQDSLMMSDEEIAQISIIIRQLFLGDFSLEQLDLNIKSVFKNNSEKEIYLISQFINKKIITIIPKQDQDEDFEDKEESLVKTVSIPLEQALVDFSKIAYQEITKGGIKLINFSELVRPSIENWITDFRYNAGPGKHSPIDRGNYLFHSENGKKLTPAERQKVGMILKSLDEQTPLNIDPERQVVLFGNENVSQSDSKPWIPDQVRNDNVNVLGSRGGNVLNRNGNSFSNSEPRDIFELKIDTVGKTLSKKPEPQPIVSPNISRMDVAPVRNIPANLPTADTNDGYGFKKESFNIAEETPNKFGSLEFNQTSNTVPKTENETFFKPQPKMQSIVEEQPKFESSFKIEPKTETIFKAKPEVEAIVEEKPKVEFKNISFSPNFAAAAREKQLNSPTKQILPSQAPADQFKDSKVEQKEELFSIPGSKPPIGTAHYDIDKAKMEEKIAAITTKSFAGNKVEVAPVVSPLPKINNSAGQNLIQGEGDKKNSIITSDPINLQDLDSLSDEDLFKLYQEKKAANKPTGVVSKPKGFHIGPMTESNEAKMNNVVDLRNSN